MKKQKKVNILALVFRVVCVIVMIACVAIATVKFIKRPDSYDKWELIVFLLLLFVAISSFFSLIYQGNTDTVTKLPNVDSFTLSAVKLMLGKKLHMYASFFINIKNFKHINRIAGNSGGDQALFEYSKKIKNFLVKGEYVGRLGGDNFIAIVYKHRVDDFVDLLKNMTVTVKSDNEAHDLDIYSRVGIYTLSDRDTVSELFNCPSIALNYAKNFGSDDYVWFQKFMLEKIYEEKEIAYTFTNAIQNKEFKVYYQPKVNVEANKICGGEALVRWERNGTLLMPDSFIPSLEKSGLLSILDFYVMEQVCSDLRDWIQRDIPVVPVSSNFSKAHLNDKNFVHHVMAIISQYQIPRELFQVEVTESFGVDLELLKSFFAQLHMSGISTLIDDFGAGGFSWTLLKDPNIDAVKLDKSIIENIELNGGANEDSLLARNIIHACYDLGKEIICEGVENVLQRDMLCGMRCNTIQGYLYDQPLPAQEFEKLLVRQIYTDLK